MSLQFSGELLTPVRAGVLALKGSQAPGDGWIQLNVWAPLIVKSRPVDWYHCCRLVYSLHYSLPIMNVVLSWTITWCGIMINKHSNKNCWVLLLLHHFQPVLSRWTPPLKTKTSWKFEKIRTNVKWSILNAGSEKYVTWTGKEPDLKRPEKQDPDP